MECRQEKGSQSKNQIRFRLGEISKAGNQGGYSEKMDGKVAAREDQEKGSDEDEQERQSWNKRKEGKKMGVRGGGRRVYRRVTGLRGRPGGGSKTQPPP